MIKITDILQEIPHLRYIGDEKLEITHPVQANSNETNATTVTWVSDKNISLLEKINNGLVVCSEQVNDFKEGCNYIITDNPRLAFKNIVANFFDIKEAAFISPNSFINPTVKLGSNVTIGHFVVIEKDCVIGDNSVIGNNTVLKRQTIVGSNVVIGCNNTIGGVGFGYEKDTDGAYSLMPHLGNVIIKDHVEIGNNTCIDRAVMGSTILHEHVKVDNLVHIAHGVVIGRNSLIIANAMIGGSTTIGENVWFAPSACVLNKKTIADDAVIGMAAVVVKDVKKAEVIVGNPGKPLTK